MDMNSNTYHIHFNNATVHFDTGANITAEARPEGMFTPFAEIPDNKADILKPLIQLLVNALAPARIYKVEHKDVETHEAAYIDLLLVMPDSCITPFTELEPVLELGGLKDHRICCSLYKQATVLTELRKSHIFYRRFFTPQHLIYDNGTTTLPEQTREEREAMNEQVRQHFIRYRSKAWHFYESAKRLPERGAEPVNAFLLHQAAELGFRAILETLNGYCKKTHYIRSLKKLTRRCAPQLGEIFPDNSPEEARLIDLLEGAYSNARYDVTYSIDEVVLDALYVRIERLLETIEAVFEHALEEQV